MNGLRKSLSLGPAVGAFFGSTLARRWDSLVMEWLRVQLERRAAS